MIYGYARVSTEGQTVEEQARQLDAAGCTRVFREVASGAKTNRMQLRLMLDKLQPDDVVIVTRLDRLARSTRDLLNTLALIEERKAHFRSLAEEWANTSGQASPYRDLMTTILAGFAAFERSLINTRMTEGRKIAKQRGVKFGRKPKLTPHQRSEALRRLEAGDPVTEIARDYNIHHSNISRLQPRP
jgi:DNA invertase Pin-like site-specific DNA recombinase